MSPISASASRPNVASRSPRATWRGARRLPIGLALIVLCILGMVALPNWSAGHSAELRTELREVLTPIEITLERVHREVLGIANDIRGLWLTGDRSFVANFGAADLAVQAGLARAQELVDASDPVLARETAAARQAYLNWLTYAKAAVTMATGAAAQASPAQNLFEASTARLADFTVQMDRATARVRAREDALRNRAAEFQRVERVVMLVLGTLASVVVAYVTWLALALLRAQRAALEERDQLEAVLASVDSGVLLLDRDLQVAVANERAGELLGVPLEELVGSDQRQLARERLGPRVDNPEAFEKRLGYLDENPDAVYEDLVHIARPEPRTLSRYGAPVRDESGAVMGRVEVYRDVSEILRRERELAEANERKDRFVATLSHELRTPLTPILGWIELLRGERDPSRMRRALDAIRRNVELEAQLVEDLLDLSKVVNQKLELDFELVDVGGAVAAAVDTVRHLAETKGVRLEVRLPAHPLAVAADETRFIQVVWNLLSNAIKFTPPGGRVSLAAEEAGERLRVVVEDEGQGIPVDFLQHVFTPFEQGHDGRNQAGGLGIGLALARSLVKLHGGEILAESEGPGRGARFTFWIPRSHPGVAGPRPASGAREDRRSLLRRSALSMQAPTPVGARTPEREASPRPRVLVVEDNPDTLEAMRVLLDSWGFGVTAVDNVPAALASAREKPPEAIISDIGMPGVDGLAFAAEVRKSHAQQRLDGRVLLIAITGFASKADRARALAAGFDAYLTKPIDFTSLRELLERTAPVPEPQRA